jgi:hypothetical protein
VCCLLESTHAAKVTSVNKTGYTMRTMEIPRFPHAVQITDFETYIRERLSGQVIAWPDQTIPLVGYMAWPNNQNLRDDWLNANQSDNQSALNMLLRKLKIIQQHWARMADICHLHYDLSQGGHQKRRGGPSVGKAISLIAANAKSKGTGTAKLWVIWKTYKDVGHLVTAAVFVCADARERHRKAPFGVKLHEFQPFRMAMLLPELVLGVAMSIQRYGLQFVAHARTEPLFDPDSLWRIPEDVNLTPFDFLTRRITKNDLAVLRARRAGNRGKANIKTTPVAD